MVLVRGRHLYFSNKMTCIKVIIHEDYSSTSIWDCCNVCKLNGIMILSTHTSILLRVVSLMVNYVFLTGKKRELNV